MAISFSMSGLYDKITSANNVYVYPEEVKKKIRTADNEVQDIQEDIDLFRKKVRSLQNYSTGTYSKTNLKRQFNEFADSFNDLKEKHEKMESDGKRAIGEKLTELDELMKEHKKELRKIGLKYDEEDGTLEFDEEKFDEAEREDIEVLLVGNTSFIRETTKMVRALDRSAQEEEFSTKEILVHPAKRYSESEIRVAREATALQKSLQETQKLADKMTEGTLAQEDVINVYYYTEQFVEAYGDLMKETDFESDNISYMINQTKENEANLNAIGITINEDHTLAIEEKGDDVVLTDESFKNAYTALFGEDAAYAKLMTIYTKEIFQNILNTESLGVSIDLSV